MPFITLHTGNRINVAQIKSYNRCKDSAGAPREDFGSFLHLTSGDSMDDCWTVSETPEQLDALIRAAVLAEEHALQVTRLSAEEAIYNAQVRRCRVCGCTDDHACESGCSWVETDLCSACRGLAKVCDPS